MDRTITHKIPVKGQRVDTGEKTAEPAAPQGTN